MMDMKLKTSKCSGSGILKCPIKLDKPTNKFYNIQVSHSDYCVCAYSTLGFAVVASLGRNGIIREPLK
jgi:hypothetical protein